ncbi:MAG: right-handed parallel beta-helix repeat-containing protein, partial [Phycisphaerae bacterium]
GVAGCDIYNIGDSGIDLTGGDRGTLTPAGHFAVNNHIHHYSRAARTYRTAVSTAGVGNRVAHNLIHDAPHMAIGLNGNEHVIEFNEIHTVCMDTDDAGAFYMGRDWTWRGNVIRYNYFHHIGRFRGQVGVQSVYLDDWASGSTVFGNVFYKAGRGVLIGGGRDNTVENNIFVACTPAVHIDSRGLGWANSYFDGRDNTLVERLNAVPYREPPWSTRYPELLKLYDDEPAVAKGNRVVRNICVGGRWLDLLDKLDDKIVYVKDNLVNVDPHFVDAEHQDFRLKDDSPAYKLGFKTIPVKEIGLQDRRARARQ